MSNKKAKSNHNKQEQETSFRKLSSKYAETAAMEDNSGGVLAKNNNSSQFSFKNENKKMNIADSAQSTVRKDNRIIKRTYEGKQEQRGRRNKGDDGGRLPVGVRQYSRYKKAQRSSEDGSNRSVQSNKRQKAVILSINKPKHLKSNNSVTHKQEKPQQQSLTKRKELPKLIFYKNEEGKNVPKNTKAKQVKNIPQQIYNKEEVGSNNQFMVNYKSHQPQYAYKKHVHEKGEDKMFRLKNKLGFIFEMADRDEVPSVSYYSQSSSDSKNSVSKRSRTLNQPIKANKNISSTLQKQKKQAIRQQRQRKTELQQQKSQQSYSNRRSPNNQHQAYKANKIQKQIPKKNQTKLKQSHRQKESQQEMKEQKLQRKPIVIFKKSYLNDNKIKEKEKEKHQEKQKQEQKKKQKQRQRQKYKFKQQEKDNKRQKQQKKQKAKPKQQYKQKQKQKQRQKQRQQQSLRQKQEQKQKQQLFQKQRQQGYKSKAKPRQKSEIKEDDDTVKNESESYFKDQNNSPKFQIKLQKVLTDDSFSKLQSKKYITQYKQQNKIAKKLNFDKQDTAQYQQSSRTANRINKDIQSSRVSQKQEEYLDEEIAELMKKNDEYLGVAKKQIEQNQFEKDKDYSKDSKPNMRKIIHFQPRRRIKTELNQRQEDDNRMLTEKQKQFLRLLKSKQEQLLHKIKQEIGNNPRPFFGDSYEFKPQHISSQFERRDHTFDEGGDHKASKINPSTKTYEVSKMLPVLSVASTRPKKQIESHLIFSPFAIKRQKQSEYSTNMSRDQTFNSIRNPNYSIKLNGNEVSIGRYNEKNYDSSGREYRTQNISEKYERLKRLMKRIQ